MHEAETMTEHEQSRHLDELLDSALSAYSAVEPGPGLETRILANLREAESREVSRPWRFKWMWAGAAVAAVAAILMFVLPRMGHRPYTAPRNNVAHTQPPAPQPVASPDNTLAHTHSSAPPSITVQQRPPVNGSSLRHGRQMRAVIPVENAALPVNQRPAVFPSPSPLTEQEKFLLSYYARTPWEELVAQSHPDVPPGIDNDESQIAVPDLVPVPQKSSNTR
jgi:hypothetical protein